jgi:phosphatidate cytidylyltransferase
MLKQRVITALVLLALLLPALFYPQPWPFCAMALALMAAATWEWGRLNGLSHGSALALGAACLGLCALAWYWDWPTRRLDWLWPGTGAAWVVGGVWLLYRGAAGWGQLGQGLRLVVGLVVLCVAWLAVAQARVVGIGFLLSVMALVWVADIGAYFAGRRWGGRWVGRKLAPSISPGKSWEGVAGGLAAVAVLAGGGLALAQAWPHSPPTLFSHLHQHGLVLMALALVFLAAMSVVGDLSESLIKRSAGVKDSSGLLPGHGGVLDRVDALLPVMPLAMLLYNF